VRRGYADSPEGQIFYLDTGGDGEPIVFLHASPRSASQWLDVLPLIEDSYRGIAIDMPGYGTSSPPPVRDGRADLESMGRCVAHVLDALGIERAHVCGIHTGAHVSVRAAVQTPARIGALVLVGYPLIESAEDVADFNAGLGYEHVQRFARVERSPDGRHLMKYWADAYAQVLKNWLLKGGPVDERTAESHLRVPTGHRHTWSFLTEHDLDVVHRYVEDLPRATHLVEIFAVMIEPSADLLTRVEAPTLHIDPASVYESPYCRRGDRVAELIPDCRNLSLEGTDDNMPEFDAPKLAQALREFVGTQR
jgi:pimeloyl-ACP methyl ester carboxylesterase